MLYTFSIFSGFISVTILIELGAYFYYGVVDLLIDFFLDVTSLSLILTTGPGLAELLYFDVYTDFLADDSRCPAYDLLFTRLLFPP